MRHVKTIGVDFGVKQVKIPETDCVVELFLFDCPGQGVFNKLEQVRRLQGDRFEGLFFVMVDLCASRNCSSELAPRCVRNATRTRDANNFHPGQSD